MNNNRIDLVRKKLIESSLDSLLISNYYNILYLTGFKTLTTDEREAFVLITHKNIYLFTDARYSCTNSDISVRLIESGKGLFFHLGTIIKDEKLKSLGIESEDLRVFEYEKLKSVFNLVNIIPLEKTVIKLRAIKDTDERLNISKACEFTGDCLKQTLPFITLGESEKNIAFRMEKWIKEHGYDLAFDPIVAIDTNSAIPHYNTKEGNGVVNKGSVILIDFGIKYHDYMSDITRMVFVNPSDEAIDKYEKLLEIQEQTLEQIKTEKNPVMIDRFCRDNLIKVGLPNFSHSLGHGVGLEVHEYPKLSQVSNDTLIEGNVFTIEPGVYFPNTWGMRIEDTVSIENGKVQILTNYTKEPVII